MYNAAITYTNVSREENFSYFVFYVFLSYTINILVLRSNIKSNVISLDNDKLETANFRNERYLLINNALK